MGTVHNIFSGEWRIAVRRVALLALVASALCAGCRPRHSPQAAALPPLASPAELSGARLLFERPDGIWLLTLGTGEPLRIAEGGRWPRWAPDGRSIAFVRLDRIVVLELDGRRERELATARKPRAVAFHPEGREVWYTDGNRVLAVPVGGGTARKVLANAEFLELDIAPDGRFAVATVRALGGYRVSRFELPSGARRDLARGCSASVSADGRRITVNRGGHEVLDLVDAERGETTGEIRAPPSVRLDNQKWSNHPDWIAAVTEGARKDIVVQRVSDGRAWRVTDFGDADRPDLRVD